jgi:hypothetical protein
VDAAAFPSLTNRSAIHAVLLTDQLLTRSHEFYMPLPSSLGTQIFGNN